jgi:hypothetical protein
VVDHALDLRDHDAAVVLGGHRNRQHLANHRLAIHRDVTEAVGRRAADQSHVHRQGLVPQVRLAVNLDTFDHRLRVEVIELAAAVDRVDERVEPNLRRRPWPLGCAVAEHVADDALRQIVALDFTRQRHLAHLWRKPPVATDDALQQACVRKVHDALRFAVALAGAVHGCQGERRALRQETPLDRRCPATRESIGP